MRWALVLTAALVLGLASVLPPPVWQRSFAPDQALARAVAVDITALNRTQQGQARYLANKYRIALEPVAALVQEAHRLEQSLGIPAELILAVAAVESNFHPYSENPSGAQGLMQVRTELHQLRYRRFGGQLSAFDPITNMRVGAALLADVIEAKQGSIKAGLGFYVGGHNGDTIGYSDRVLAEMARLKKR